jgi:1,4-dihydroxy-2-naphthoate octaprenyltransferase
LLYYAGARYWTASVLPAVAGTLHPLWLRPRVFTSINWMSAFEFLVATVLVHAGFYLFKSRLEGRAEGEWTRPRLLWLGVSLLSLACALGLHLSMQTNQLLMLVYGAMVLVAGLIYTAPPAMLSQRLGGEVAVSMSLGMIPMLGAYVVQVGDLTRTVYAASLPIIVVTGLWVLTGLLETSAEDRKAGRESVVSLLGERFCGRVAVPVMVMAAYAFLVAAVVFGSLTPWVLVALVGLVPAWRVVCVSREHYEDGNRMADARRSAFVVHLVLSACIAFSSLLGLAR